jgi:hypothetical protein
MDHSSILKVPEDRRAWLRELSRLSLQLFLHHAFDQIARLIYVQALDDCHVVGE